MQSKQGPGSGSVRPLCKTGSNNEHTPIHMHNAPDPRSQPQPQPATHLAVSLTTSATCAHRRTAPSLTAASGPTQWLSSCAASQACCGTAWNTTSLAAQCAAARCAAALAAHVGLSSCSSSACWAAGKRGGIGPGELIEAERVWWMGAGQ